MNVTLLLGKRDFKDVIKLMIMKWRDYPGVSRWPKVISKVLVRGRPEGQVYRERMSGQKQRSLRRESATPLP